ncbi:MAG: chromate transporter [Prevotellaceae bacterium]|jgi:chromate transporter|nr:chromate transporter [Prevotellaceae bacterium]
MIYLLLFYTFFKIGLFGFGGGYGMISLIQFEIVEKNHWLTSEQFANILVISQTTPGPIGINSATYVGYATAGFMGSAVATFAIVLPSFILMLLVAKIIAKFKENPYVASSMQILRLVVIGLIAAAALLMVTEETFGQNYSDIVMWAIFGITFIAVKWLKINPIVMILIAAIFGIILF